MISAYDNVYLERAKISLGRMLDFAVYDLGYTLEEFINMFIASGVATLFEYGDSGLLAGKSGVEIAYLVLEKSGHTASRDVRPAFTQGRSPEYWLGWALAYFQWETNLSFQEIITHIPVKDILALYTPYHEMDIRHFTDKMKELYHSSKKDTNLKRIRNSLGLSQSELALLSGIPKRTLQQYEQRQKNINKASCEYLLSLSKTLHCKIEDLMEI